MSDDVIEAAALAYAEAEYLNLPYKPLDRPRWIAFHLPAIRTRMRAALAAAGRARTGAQISMDEKLVEKVARAIIDAMGYGPVDDITGMMCARAAIDAINENETHWVAPWEATAKMDE